MKKNFLAFFIILCIITIACKKQKHSEITYSEEMAKIVSQVTNGDIRDTDKIQVKFVNPMVSSEDLNKPLEKSIFKFSPKIKGKTYWGDLKTLIFEPSEPLQYRKSYTGELDLGKISDELKEKKLEILKFSFSIRGRELKDFTGELVLKNRNNPKLLNYRGKISFTEKVELEVIKDATLLKKGSKKYELNWTSETDGYTFSFISEDLTRDNSTQSFSISIDKNKLNLLDDFEKDFQVTPIAQMKVVKVNKQEEGRVPKIYVEFSDEFDPEQNLNGLINVEPKAELKIQRLGNTVILDGNFSFGTNYSVIVEAGVRSRWGTETTSSYKENIRFSDIKPQVEFASDGIILPSENKNKVQFYTSNLKRVHIEVKKVYEESLAEFIQTEQLNSLKDRKTSFNGSYINRLGVIVHNETFEISDHKNNWLLSEIDLSGVIKENDKGLYLIRLNFNPRDVLVDINEEKLKYIEEYGQVYKPIFLSNIGLTCKRAGDFYYVIATDINTSKPLRGVNVQLKRMYNNYDPILASGVTDSEGLVKFFSDGYYYSTYIEAEKDGQRSVIKFNEMEWNISGFDIGGIDEYKQGTKAYVYTERGVYRPGDEMNISVIVRNQSNSFPDNHPLTMQLYNPEGKKVYEITNRENKEGFFNFTFQTKDSDPTGNWNASFDIGNKEFSHTIKIETIVPYRLKVKVEPENIVISWSDNVLKLDVISSYLFGNPASNLPVEVDAEITEVNKRFPKYEKFVFNNPCLDFSTIQKDLFKGSLDENGVKHIEWELPSFHGVPSALNIKVTAKVLEKGGRPNINWANIPVEPYEHYVGLQPLKYYYVATGTDTEIPVIFVNNSGEPVAGKSLKYRIYLNSEYWWYQYDNDRNLRFKTDRNTSLIKEGTIVTTKTHYKLQFLPIEKGNYFVEVTDENGTGHSSGIFISAYPYGGVASGDKNAGTLALSADKEKYYVGDIADIQFPTPKEGTILVTIEKENEIIEQKWYYPDGNNEKTIRIPITKEMVPNAYVSISLLQPHAQTVNDRPIRMFGILPLLVEDRETKHEIEIITSEQFRPKEPFEITIQTKDQKQTQFTIAVVDEGLLDITQFKTPDPWKHFFRKTRLKVLTYDIFSHVISALKGDVFKTFSIGGDMDYRESQQQPEKGKKRFKPVCMFKGPIKTDANGKAVVQFEMPNYVGSVRVMVIGARGNSYARAEKAVTVKSELMLLGTLPRVIGPGEKFTIPVSVFAMKDKIGKVNVSITTEGPLTVDGAKTQTLNFNKATDQDCFFNIVVKPEAGQSKVVINASSDQYNASYEVDLMVRPTSPRIYGLNESVVEPGKNISIAIPENGIKGTNNATLTISNFPSINFSHRLRWLINYPYGCIEQTTSAVLPQLYLKKFMKYPDAFSEDIDQQINNGLERLRKFQQYSGGFSYWPYGNDVSEWGTLYAGHFMVEAKKLGYHVVGDLYDNWLNYNKQQARRNTGDLMYRVYRVYILALSGNPVMNEMNQLKESKLKEMDNTQKWLLAATYKLAGLPEKVDEIIKDVNLETKDYAEFSGTYGSGLRDKAMILDALVVLEKYDLADQLTRDIAKHLSATSWYSTQTIGYSLLAMGKYINVLNNQSGSLKIKGSVKLPNGETVTFDSDKSFSLELNEGFGKSLQVILESESSVKKAYTTLTWNGVPLESNLQDKSENLSVKVNWYDDKGNPLNINEIKQGTTFWGHFSVRNESSLKQVDEIALVQILPSGWEIENTRLLEESTPNWATGLKLNHEDYLDIRDDRIMWFFDLHQYDPLNNEIDFMVKLNAVTVGEFELPGTLVEAMYNGSFKATKAGVKVRVVKP
ncbi:MAG: hypothetical protein A2W99_11120 [Bacteroidetes bacterium GWF2_33_16]|nr:MAG: hypothetical protein A2X00_04620 [Bacteroidetes bacterium GWE2_32_14]OFY04087.1 MAG: hypothetical protein A2W99_11120 [Bacteroidetes bacterium GWF2_33_16]